MTAATEVQPAWRCEGCGRVSQASHKPQHHWRRGEHCGPFAPATIGPDGAVLAPAGAAIVQHAAPTRPTTYRQSLLRSFEVCPRRALHELQLPGDLSVGNVESSADLGSATHAVLTEILATLRKHGVSLDEHGHRHVVEQLSTQEGVEIMYETLTAGEWVLTADDRDDLRAIVLNFCTYYRWQPSRIMAIERQLSTAIVCPDGKTRTLTGTPDVILSDPGQPPGLVIVDWKSGRGKPRSRSKEPQEGEAIVGREYLSVGGTYQLDIYGLLALREYPRAQRVTLREAWLRFGERREATLGRDELEHVEREIAIQMMLLDRAIDKGPDSGSKLTHPRPGRQCLRACPVKRSCPIPEEQRGEGAISSPDEADAEAQRWVKVSAVDKELRAALKAWHEETGHCPEAGDGRVVRWDGEKPGRKFGVHPPVVTAADPAVAVRARESADDAFVAAMEAELAKQGEKAPVAP